MKVGRPFKPTGRRLENLSNLIKSKYPQDKWVLEPIIPVFLYIFDSNSTLVLVVFVLVVFRACAPSATALKLRCLGFYRTRTQ